jgi:hypothetical protein
VGALIGGSAPIFSSSDEVLPQLGSTSTASIPAGKSHDMSLEVDNLWSEHQVLVLHAHAGVLCASSGV